MYASLEWIKEFTPAGLAPSDLAERLTMQGLEVSSVKEINADLSCFQIACIEKIEKHPGADRLKLVTVQTVSGTMTVICGADNTALKALVILAGAGAVLPGGLQIKKTEIRGVESSGMLCSREELGLEKKSSGIWILDNSLTINDPVSKVLGNHDFIFNIEITSNRPDCLSIRGIAREAAIAAGASFNTNDSKKYLDKSGNLSIEVKNPENCPRYCGRLIKNVKIGPSPLWLSRRLETHGIRSINNVVDVTNYVLLEYGHPLHAFDYDKLSGKCIIVRNARLGEKIKTLDGTEHILSETDTVIADAEKPVALAGIMGGANSEVDQNTASILLESACFSKTAVHKTARRLKVSSEASLRFEKGTDIEGLEDALHRAVELILKTAGGEIASKLKDVYARKTPQEILLSWAAVEKKLAVKIPAAKITDYLKKLGFAVKFSDKDKIKVQIPSWRVDIGAEADLIEEIARLYGYNNLPESLPSCRNSDYSIRVTRGKNFRQAALALGYTEICNFSFVNKEFYLAAGLPNLLKVLNPVSSETEYLRPDFLYGMLKTLKTNHDNNPSRHGYKFFETGRCFLPDNNNEYKEFSAAGFLTAGAPGQTNWINTPRPADFYDLSGDIAAFLKKCGYKSNIEISGDLLFSPGGIISAADVPIGRIGHLADNIIKAADAGFSDIFYAFIDLDRLPQSAHKTRKFRPLSAFPASFRDLAFVLKQNISAASITEFIRNFSEYITGCTLISLYRGEAIEKDSVSAAFSIEYRRSDKTMQKGEIDEIENRLIKIITEKFSARLR